MTPITQPERQSYAGRLPREVREMLIAATRIADEKDRRVAIDTAIDYAKLHFPQYFQTQPEKD